MNKLTLLAGVVSASLCTAAIADNTYIPSYLEQGLISICKSAALDKSYKMNKAIKEYRLNHKIVALNVVCNGQDIISFAQHYGAERTTQRLSDSVGRVEVTDIAAVKNYNYDVTFNF